MDECCINPFIDYAIFNGNKYKLPRNKCNKTYKIFIKKM